MDKDLFFILAPQRWGILQSITKGKRTPTTISKELNLSLAYVNNQLNLLAAAGWVKQEKAHEKKIGKPRTEYSIAKDLVIITAISSKDVSAINFKPAKRAQFIFNTLFQKNELELYFFQKFYYQYEDLITSTKLMAFLETKDSETHFFTISADVDAIRKKYSNITLKNPEGKERKIIIWSHTQEETEQGLKNKEHYYLEKIQKAQPFWENGTTIEHLKKLLGEAP